MSDLGFKGTYAHSNDSPIESAGAPATNLSDTKLDILMRMFVKFQDSVELQQAKTTHEMAEMKIELGSIRSPASSSQHEQTTFPDRQADNRQTSMFLGSPLSNNSDQSTDHVKPQIAFIQSQVVYDVETSKLARYQDYVFCNSRSNAWPQNIHTTKFLFCTWSFP